MPIHIFGKALVPSVPKQVSVEPLEFRRCGGDSPNHLPVARDRKGVPLRRSTLMSNTERKTCRLAPGHDCFAVSRRPRAHIHHDGYVTDMLAWSIVQIRRESMGQRHGWQSSLRVRPRDALLVSRRSALVESQHSIWRARIGSRRLAQLRTPASRLTRHGRARNIRASCPLLWPSCSTNCRRARPWPSGPGSSVQARSRA